MSEDHQMGHSDGVGQESSGTQLLHQNGATTSDVGQEQQQHDGSAWDKENVDAIINLYNLGFRIRLLGYSTVCLGYLVALAVGGFAQELVVPYMMQEFPPSTSFLCFLVFPIIFVFQAIWVDAALDMFLDAMSNPCLLHLRRVFRSVGLHWVTLPRLDTLIIFCVHRVAESIGSFEALPLVSILGEVLFWGGPKWERGPMVFVADYIRGGVLATLLLTTAAVVARLLLKLGYCTDDYHHRCDIRRLGMALRDSYFEPSSNQVALGTPNPDMNTVDSVDMNRNFAPVDGYKYLKTWMFALLSMFAISVCFLLFMESKTVTDKESNSESITVTDVNILSGMILVLAVLIFQYICTRCSQRGSVLGGGYLVCLMIALLLASLGYLLHQYDPFETANGGELIFTPPPEGDSHQAPLKPGGEYPVCLNRWGSNDSWPQENKLTIIDIALFAQAVYRNDSTVEELVGNFTKDTPLEKTTMVNSSDQTRAGAWRVFEIPELKMRIVAVRGTMKAGCILFDLNLWAQMAVLQSFRVLIPIFDDLPIWSIRRVVGLSLAETLGSPDKVWTDLERVTKEYKNMSDTDGYGLLITGHSLGGGLASIVGAHLGIPAVAFSAPGAFYSMEKFMTNETAMYTLVNVIPAHDIVPQIDYQAAIAEQHIECSACGPKAIAKCHAIGRTVCELYRRCGDTREREYSQEFATRSDGHDPKNRCNPRQNEH